MKLMHPLFSEPLQWKQNCVCTLVLENIAQYRACVHDFLEQAEGLSGKYILSRENVPLDVKKTTEVITDLFSLNFANKAIVTGLHREITVLASQEHEEKTYALLEQLQALLAEIALELDGEIEYNIPADLSSLLKAVGVIPASDYETPAEKILSYLSLSSAYTKKTLFIIVGLRQYLTESECRQLFADLAYRNIKLLCLEPADHGLLPFEMKKVIDCDLCEI